MAECYLNPNINLLTYSELMEVSGEAGNFKVKILKKAKYVDEKKCTGCGDCSKNCPVEIPNQFEMNLAPRKAIYRPFPQAVPNKFTIDKRGISPCRNACPAGVNAQGYIALISQAKFKEALALIREKNPFPAICSRVCHHPCEEECNRKELEEPIAVAALKRFVADWGLEHYEKPARVEKTRKEKIAVIGSGPAGLTCAYYLAKLGYPVTVFEGLPTVGGMLAVGIPEYRLPKKVLQAEIDYIKDLGVEIKTNTKIESITSLKG
ncbi:MAG: FAD-dependent oxidoreductase, partial [Candidatus Thermoplasmatota archaeon]|nr:FAD-dependent oxidoreductase [Candidatus Thermoplasmatota archaeon]